MKKKDTALYKFKVCAVSILLCGLFTVFAVGCSNQEADNPENTSNHQNGSAGSPSVNTISKITLPTNDSTGSFSGGRPTGSKETLPDKITMGEISIIPITKPEPSDETTSSAATADNENTKFSFDFSRGTFATGDFFDIGEDTTPTMVYGFNG